jgi:hypothetical protein
LPTILKKRQNTDTETKEDAKYGMEDSIKRHERSDKLRANFGIRNWYRKKWMGFIYQKGVVGLKKGKPTVNYIEEHVSHT